MMDVGEFLKPSFALDQAGLDKEVKYPIVEIEGDYVFIKTGFNLRFPVHRSKIVDIEKFEHDAAKNYRSKTWVHTK